MRRLFFMVLVTVCAGAAIYAPGQTSRPFNAFYFPSGIVADSKDNIYVCGMNHKIIRISPDGVATDFAGNPKSYVGDKDGHAFDARFSNPREMAIDADDNIYVTEATSIRKVTPSGEVTTLAGGRGGMAKDGPLSTASFKHLKYIAVDGEKNLYVIDIDSDPASKAEYNIVRKISATAGVSTLKNGDGSAIRLKGASGLACDKSGNIFVCDVDDRCIKRIAPDSAVSVVVGKCGTRKSNPVYREGDADTAELMTPACLILGRNGELIFSDLRLNRIIQFANHRVTTLAGNSAINLDGANAYGYSEAGYKDGKARLALFNSPDGITMDRAGNIFIVDAQNQCVRKLTPDGIVSTFYK